MGLTLVTLWNTTFHIFFSQPTNLRPCDNSATLRKRKINVISDQSEESNPVVSPLVFCTSDPAVLTDFC